MCVCICLCVNVHVCVVFVVIVVVVVLFLLILCSYAPDTPTESEKIGRLDERSKLVAVDPTTYTKNAY